MKCLQHGFFQPVAYFRPRNTRTEMYAGRVACCPLVSHVDYSPRALLRLEKTGQTDGRMPDRTVALRLPLDAARVTKCHPNAT